MTLAVGCGGKGKVEPEPVGNLMAPPTIETELCVDVEPANASVTIDGVAATDRCTPVSGYAGQIVRVEVLAPGRGAVVRELSLVEVMAPLKLELIPPRPVGNLMPPPDLIKK